MAGFVVAGMAAAYAQGMLLDAAADRVIQKYATSNCDELKKARAEGPSEKEKLTLDFLRNDD